MNKKIFTLLIISAPFALFSCKGSNIDLPKSPFDDHYERIGMNSEYEVNQSLEEGEYEGIKNYIDNEADEPTNVLKFTHQEETRDLKYAYFGQESSTVSQCSMLSSLDESNRFGNNVTISNNVSNQQLQSANSGIIKTTSMLDNYTFDVNYSSSLANEYKQTRRVKNNDEPEIITEVKPITSYTSAEEDGIFGLYPLERIKSTHFKEDTKIRDKDYTFKLLADNNQAVYGRTKDNKFLIKEGYSLFAPFRTTMGRSYMAEDNFFYEGLLESYVSPVNDETKYRFTYFRFYHELVILSESFDGEGVPVLYLEKPVLIEYSEDKYNIQYRDGGEFPDYDGPTIPDVK